MNVSFFMYFAIPSLHVQVQKIYMKLLILCRIYVHCRYRIWSFTAVIFFADSMYGNINLHENKIAFFSNLTNDDYRVFWTSDHYCYNVRTLIIRGVDHGLKGRTVHSPDYWYGVNCAYKCTRYAYVLPQTWTYSRSCPCDVSLNWSWMKSTL